MKYIDAELLRKELEWRITDNTFGAKLVLIDILAWLDSLQQEQQMPDSTQLIAEWEREKAVLEQKDFRGDAERMAYNAFLDGFVKGIGYGCTK